METISNGAHGLLALLLVGKQFELVVLVTVVVLPKRKKLKVVIFLTVVIQLHGLPGRLVVLLASLVTLNEHMDGRVITNLTLPRERYAMLVKDSILIGLHGDNALKLAVADIKPETELIHVVILAVAEWHMCSVKLKHAELKVNGLSGLTTVNALQHVQVVQ